MWVRAPLWPHVRQAKFCLRVCQVVFLGVNMERGGFLLCYIPLSYGFTPHYGQMFFQNKNELSRRKCSGCWFHGHIPGKPRYVLAFLHLRQPAFLVHLGKRGYNCDVVRLRHKEVKSALAGFYYVFEKKCTSRQRSGKCAIRKRFPLQKLRWEKLNFQSGTYTMKTHRKPKFPLVGH